MRLSLRIAVLIIFAFVMWGCPEPSKIERGRGLKPELTLQIATLSLENLNKRIEKKHINELAKVLKKEKVEILAVQGLSRYPGVSTRIDLVDELAQQMDWRNAFGEMSNISGKQTGNSVFSLYPIVSYYNHSFNGIKSAQFEAALETIIDAGVFPVMVVSAHLPLSGSSVEQGECIKLIMNSAENRTRTLVIITGNLPSGEIIQYKNSFKEVSPKPGGETAPRMWYSAGVQTEFIRSRAVKTELGTVVIAELALFQ